MILNGEAKSNNDKKNMMGSLKPSGLFIMSYLETGISNSTVIAKALTKALVHHSFPFFFPFFPLLLLLVLPVLKRPGTVSKNLSRQLPTVVML